MNDAIRHLFLLCLTCVAWQPGNAQVSRRLSEETVSYFLANQFRISVRPALARKASVTPNATYDPGASNFISLGAGIDYYCHFSESFSLITGLHGLWHGSNFTFLVPKTVFQPELDYDLDQSGSISGGLNHGLLSLQSTLEKRWFSKKETIWSAGLGLALNYSLTTNYEFDYNVYHNGQLVNYAWLGYNANNQSKPFLSAHAMAGRYWKIGKDRFIITNFVIDYSFTNFAKGYYSFNVPGKPVVTGDYKIDGSYAAIDVSYPLSRKKRR
ncbi:MULTISPECIES: hypothetical protein [Niastella]|uniref:Outer membrane protein beta-barrel domain-containing protein n=1 Tax=Niastella soli TaxID=2821487 RepID=A0ABS3YNE2_9BACT|nr:hypothetical protein [Niastella soli]MBO9199414.1 hypothetical protein [Niastella soli]